VSRCARTGATVYSRVRAVTTVMIRIHRASSGRCRGEKCGDRLVMPPILTRFSWRRGDDVGAIAHERADLPAKGDVGQRHVVDHAMRAGRDSGPEQVEVGRTG